MWNFKRDIYRTRRATTCPTCIPQDIPIGTQIWNGCNANTKFYNNGNPIPYVDNAATWASLTTGAWCYYNNDPASEATYGILYNWYAVNDPRGLAPTGYHVATDTEWTVLTNYLGGLTIAGGKLKETGLCHWVTPNTDATNTSLFTALPGGGRNLAGGYGGVGNFGSWWSSTDRDTFNAWIRDLAYNDGNVIRTFGNKGSGLSVRFIKN